MVAGADHSALCGHIRDPGSGYRQRSTGYSRASAI